MYRICSSGLGQEVIDVGMARRHKPGNVKTLAANVIDVIETADVEPELALVRPTTPQPQSTQQASVSAPAPSLQLPPVPQSLLPPTTQQSAPQPPHPTGGWGAARLLGAELSELDAATATYQSAALSRARRFIDDEKGDAEEPDELSMSFEVLPEMYPTLAAFRLSYIDSWHAFVEIELTNHVLGLLPAVAIALHPDPLPGLLPKPMHLPYLERLTIAHTFAPNDMVYNLQVTPFGPFPGADDMHNGCLFDLMAEPEMACYLLWAESPPTGATEHRGWQLPPVGRRRHRNELQGLAMRFKPASRPTSDARWAIPPHGYADINIKLRVVLPIPRWLIPNALVKWVVPRLMRKNFPAFAQLGYGFESSVFAARLRDEPDSVFGRTLEAVSKARSEASPT